MTKNNLSRSKRKIQPAGWSVLVLVTFGLIASVVPQLKVGTKLTVLLTLASEYVTNDDTNATMDNTAEKKKDGWKEIHVFVGDKRHAQTGGKSQVGQDELIAGLLRGKQQGFFLDLAANDATSLSNTYQLEEKYGWDGICIEPNSIYWRGLSYRRCTHVAVVVGKNRMEEVTFSIPGNGRRQPAGGIKGFDRKESERNTVDTKFLTVPLVEILQEFHAPTVIDYFSLDVEGAEYFIMENFPFQQYKFKTATIERPNQELVDLLYSQGYEYLAGNNKWGEETVWIHKDFKKDLDFATAISNAGYIAGSTLRYPRPYPGARPVVDNRQQATINGAVYEIGSNAPSWNHP